MVVVDEGDNKPQGMGAFRVLRRLPATTREVFLAEDAEGKPVILKVYGAPQRNQGLFDPKLADEASAYARLSHPNIVKVLDIFSADGQFVVALEYVDGSTLSVVRGMLERDFKKVPDECWLYVIHCVFAALAEAHAAKDHDGKAAPVLHRGVNPSNVLIAWDGTVKLGNFNVAQGVRVMRDSNPGLTWGSYGYFAPEQVKLETPGPQSDVYSASLMLWELLAGRKALERGSMPDADALKAMAAPSLTPLDQLRRDLPAPIRFAVRAGMEPDPKRRIASAVRIRDVLRAAIDLDAARAKLVELLAHVRTHEAQTVAPPAFLSDEPPAPPPPPPVEEVISLMPDPVSEPPPPIAAPPPAPLPVFEPPPSAPSTPVALEIAVAPPREPVPEIPVAPISRRMRSRGMLVALLALFAASAVLFVVTAIVKLGGRSRTVTAATTTSTPTRMTSTSTSASAAAPAVTATVTPSATVTATTTATATATITATAAPASSMGQITLPSSAAGHRVFVDGHVASDGAKPIDVACGRHTLRIGSHGKAQSIEVPCGGTYSVP